MLQILNRLFPDPEGSLSIVIGGSRRRFLSVEDFKEYLSRRIEVSAKKRNALLRPALTRAGAQNLHCQASTLKEAIESHQHLVSKAMVDMLMANKCIGPIASRTFSRDHAWREIMGNLNEMPPAFDAFKYQALKMYTRYMEAWAALLELAESATEPR